MSTDPIEIKNEEFFNEEHIELAARERTFDAAYTRSSLNSIVTGIFIFRIFSKVFAPVAVIYIVFGGVLGLLALYRRLVVVLELYSSVEPEEVDLNLATSPVQGYDYFQQVAEENANITRNNQKYFEDEEKRRIYSSLQADVQHKLVNLGFFGTRKVIIPADFPKQSLSADYFEWRSKLHKPPKLRKFYLSSNNVIIITLLTVLTEFLVLVFIVTST